MKDIINQIQSQFTDEIVKELIEQYIACDGNFSEFYKKIYDSELGDEKAELSLDMIPKAITKYICDNVIEFIEYCNNRQVRLIEDIRKSFAKEVEFAIMKIDRLPEDSSERKRYENEKNLYEQNINLGQTGYGIHIVVVRELIIPLKQYMEENSEKALPEMVSNYRVACNAHGIPSQGEHSIATEQEGVITQEKTLTELEQELQKLKKKDQRTTQQRDEARLLRNAYQMELDKEENP